MRRLAFLLLILLSLPLRANLGETLTQCVTRYGRPSGYGEADAKVPFGKVVFSAAGYNLLIFLIKDVEVGARVSKTDKSAFTDAEMKTIMDADATSPWVTTTSADPTCLQWARGDKATVLYDTAKHMLIFTSDEMAKALQAPAPPPPKPAAAN